MGAAPAHECCKTVAGEEAVTESEVEAPQRDLLQQHIYTRQWWPRPIGTFARMAPGLKILGLTPARHHALIELLSVEKTVERRMLFVPPALAECPIRHVCRAGAK